MEIITTSSPPSGQLGVALTKKRPTSYAEDVIRLGRWLKQHDASGPLGQDVIEQLPLGRDTHGKTLRVSLATFGWSPAGDRGKGTTPPQFVPSRYLSPEGWDLFECLSKLEQARLEENMAGIEQGMAERISMTRQAYVRLHQRNMVILSREPSGSQGHHRALTQHLIVECLRLLLRFGEVVPEMLFISERVFRRSVVSPSNLKAAQREVDRCITAWLNNELELVAEGTQYPPWPGYMIGNLEWTGFAINQKQKHAILVRSQQEFLKQFLAGHFDMPDVDGEEHTSTVDSAVSRSPDLNRAIEKHAIDMVCGYFEQHKHKVESVESPVDAQKLLGTPHPGYDLIVNRGSSQEVRIEVKGTMSDDGGLVTLTQNELTQALTQRIILAVVSSIRVKEDSETASSASGGSLDFYEWQPSKPLFTFVEFQKSVEGVKITSTFQIRPDRCPYLTRIDSPNLLFTLRVGASPFSYQLLELTLKKIDQGGTDAEIERALGISTKQLRELRDSNGRPRSAGGSNKYSTDDHNEVITLMYSGCSLQEIVEETGIPKDTVLRWRKDAVEEGFPLPEFE